jgi:ABC-type sugar transport system substrate-binding protein
MHDQSLLSRRLRGLVLAGLAAACLVASGCSSSGDTPGSTHSTGTTGSSGPTQALSISAMNDDLAHYGGLVTNYPAVKPVGGLSALKGKTIWYIPIGSAVPILHAYGVGIKAAFDKLGINYHTCDGRFLPTTIASCMSQAATQGADAVITGYIDYALVPSAFDNLISHHIPVLAAGESPSGGKTDSPQLAFYDTTQSINLLQKLAAESIIVDSNGGAKVLFVGVTDSPQTKEAADYAKKFFADNCAKCSFNEVDYNTASLNRVPSQVSAALISHPDTNYVFVELDAGVPGTATGIQTAGFANKVKMASTNGELASLQRISSGQNHYVDVGVSPVYVGWMFADGVIRMMVGELPQVQLGVFRVFTKDNVAGLTLTPDAYATHAWYGPDTFQDTSLRAWGVR